MIGIGVSAKELQACLRTADRQLSSRGKRLNEGADRVLRKLERVLRAEGLHRAYLKTGGRATMWDLLSPEELARRGYSPTRQEAYTISSEEPVKQDRVTCWISESDPAGELWVGEPLVP